MTEKPKLVLFGTRHYDERQFPLEIRAALELIIDTFSPKTVLEEWSGSRPFRSGVATLCQAKNVPWKSIGTPTTAEFETYNHTYALDFPPTANVARHGPIPIQERREDTMRQNIIREMSTFDVGVLVIGLAHLHSMSNKLSDDFDVEAFAYSLELI
jgi:hypothetical protein